MNSVNLVGRLGADFEGKVSTAGNVWGSARLAVNDHYNGEKKTYWFALVFFGKNAETATKWLSKGSQLGVTGKLVNREWEDKEGNKRMTTEIHVNQFTMLGGNGDKNGQQNNQQTREPGDDSHRGDGVPDDDIPF
jgi:single-strand DNA-binding protein